MNEYITFKFDNIKWKLEDELGKGKTIVVSHDPNHLIVRVLESDCEIRRQYTHQITSKTNNLEIKKFLDSIVEQEASIFNRSNVMKSLEDFRVMAEKHFPECLYNYDFYVLERIEKMRD